LWFVAFLIAAVYSVLETVLAFKLVLHMDEYLEKLEKRRRWNWHRWPWSE
jgi:hypothetical protein